MSYQKLTIVGNLGRDPEMRYLANGQAVTSFSIASNRSYTASSGEKVKETTWFRISAWGKQAEICNQYLKQGKQVLVEGRLTADKETGNPRIWTAQDGTPRASFEVNADRVVFLGGREDGGSGGSGAGYQDGGMPEFSGEADDDIPF